jgi:hypothetical protein
MVLCFYGFAFLWFCVLWFCFLMVLCSHCFGQRTYFATLAFLVSICLCLKETSLSFRIIKTNNMHFSFLIYFRSNLIVLAASQRRCMINNIRCIYTIAVHGGEFSTVYRTSTQQAGMLPWHWPRHEWQGYRIITVVLAKHKKMAPWLWFLREPKHVWATVGIFN